MKKYKRIPSFTPSNSPNSNIGIKIGPKKYDWGFPNIASPPQA